MVKSYFKNDFKHDLIAGMIVGLIALPLAIAFSVASGATAAQGIYTSIIAGLVMGALSGSNFQISGPTGAFIVILLGIVNQFGIEGLKLAGLMAGVILLLMGIFRFGSVIKYIPYPVTVGFTSGIGVIIFSGQIKDFLGLSFAERPHGFIETILAVFKSIQEGLSWSALIVGTVTLLVLVLWKRKITSFPAPPVALLVGTLVGIFLDSSLMNFLPKPALIGEISAGLPSFSMPEISWEKIQMLLPSAFAVAMLGAIESLLSAVVADGMTGTKHKSNQELIAQGVGNIVLPFFNGIPATGAIARTAANIKNGARTRVSSIVHALTLVLILLLAAPLAKYIPLAALAAILMNVAYNMAEIHRFVRLVTGPRQDTFVLLVTFLLTVFVDLTVAVGIGIVLAAVLFIKRVSQLSARRIQDDFEESVGSVRLHASLKDEPRIHLYEVSGPLFFGVAAEIERGFYLQNGDALILRMKHVHHIDATAINALDSLIDGILKNKGHVFLSTVHPEVRKELEKQGVIDKLGGDNFVTTSATEAIKAAKEMLQS